MFKYEKTINNSIFISNENGEELEVKMDNHFIPFIRPSILNNEYLQLLNNEIIKTPYGDIDFSKGFIFILNDLNIPITKGLLNVNNINNLYCLESMRYICDKSDSMSADKFLDISRLNAKERELYKKRTHPLDIGIDFFNMAIYGYNQEELKEDPIIFLGIDDYSYLHFKYRITDEEGNYINGKFVNDSRAVTGYQGIYIPGITFEYNADIKTVKKVLKLIFKNEKLNLGDGIGSIVLSNGIRLKIGDLVIPIFSENVDEFDRIVELLKSAKTYNYFGDSLNLISVKK